MKKSKNQLHSFSLEDINPIIDTLSSCIVEGKHILLHGDIGTGKTTLVSTLMKTLGSTDEISSPTYAVINEYTAGVHTIFHMDLYRIKTVEELIDIGFEDYLFRGSCIIEWPEIAEQLALTNTVSVTIEKLQDKRIYTIEV